MSRSLVCIAAVTLVLSGFHSLDAAEFVRSDADGNGNIDITDGIRVLGFLFLGNPTSLDCPDAADADDSGTLTITDGIYILSYLFTGGSQPSAPFPDCGEDPTPDTLTCEHFEPCGVKPLEPPASPTIDTPDSPTREDSVSLVVRAGPGAASIEVRGGASIVTETTSNAGVFRPVVPLISNHVSRLHVRAIGPTGLASASILVEIVHDGEAPFVFIDGPTDGDTVSEETIAVVGRVSDRLSGYLGLTVAVDGEDAAVAIGIGTNGTFERAGVNLAPGKNTLTVTATDGAGNSTTRETTVTYEPIPKGASRIEIFSGVRQEASARSVLPDPIVVRATDGTGSPISGQAIEFHVTKSDGRLGLSPKDASTSRIMMISVETGADGLASVYWRLGTDAGCGNNRIRVTASGLAGEPAVCASALPAAPVQINIGSGDGQRVQAGAPAPLPLRAWVSDSCNGVPDVPVMFEIVSGSGTVNGGAQAVVQTGATGHASVDFVTGTEPGNQVVRASFPGNLSASATFTTFAIARSESGKTTFVGVVTDNASRPIGGAFCELRFQGEAPILAVTESDGRFILDKIPGSGLATLEVHGTSAKTLGGNPVKGRGFPDLAFNVVIVPGVENGLGRPVLLPALDDKNFKAYSTTTDTILTARGIEGLEMRVLAGSMKLLGGKPAPNGTAIGLSQVHHDDIPMPMPDGASPPFAWTLQPAGATFDPPIEITYPNMSGLPPGAVAYFLTFDHGTHEFEIVSSGTVSDDGATIVSDPGAGLSRAGWGCNCPPYSVTANCERCSPPVNGCGPQESALNDLPIDVFPDCSLEVFGKSDGIACDTCFTPGCDEHDRCYGTCGSKQSDCDQNFLQDNWAQCDCVEDPEVKERCQKNAIVYADIVMNFGEGPHAEGQKAGCECERQQGEGGVQHHAFGGGGGIVIPEPDWTDDDHDFAPDDWEEEVGLDPTNPDDAFIDSDDDGLLNITEFFHGTDPFVVDTDGDGFSDAENAAAIQPVNRRFDATWTVSIGAQSVTVEPDGRFRLGNIAAPDSFGAEGPGSPPDFVSDDYTRVIGVRQTNKGTLWAWSEPFQLVGGETFFIGDLRIDIVPPPVPTEIVLEAPRTVLEPAETMQLSVEGILADGSPIDLTLASASTSYRSSNASFATVGPDGLLRAHSDGPVFITAVTEGVTSVLRLVISSEQATIVVVEGVLLFPDGEPADGATITSIFGSEVTADGAGAFSITLTVPAGEVPVIRIQVERAGVVYVATIRLEGDLSSGLIELGEIALEPPSSSFDFDARKDFPLGIRAGGLAVADLDLDGRPEAVVSARFEAKFEIVPGIETRRFGTPRGYALEKPAADLAVGLLDADEFPDVVIFEPRPQGLSVWLGDGAGGLSRSDTTYDVSTLVEVLELVDLDGDGALDLFTLGNAIPKIRRGLGDGTFESEVTDLPVPFSLAADFGDLDDDGRIDIVLTQPFSTMLTVVLRTPDGGYAGFAEVELGPGATDPTDVLVTDVDGDGNLDAIVAHQSGLTWVQGSGDGSFSAGVALIDGREIAQVIAGDFDGDGVLDVAGNQTGARRLVTLRGSGDGAFETPIDVGLADFNIGLESANIDADGTSDIVTVGEQLLSALEGGPNGLRSGALLLVGTSPGDIAIADFDGDDLIDIAVAADTVLEGDAAGVRVLLSRGDRTFEASADIPVVAFPTVSASDVDGDELPDLVTLALNSSPVIHMGKGDGTFETGETISMPGVLGTRASASDLNGDDRADLVVLSWIGGTVAVRLALPGGGYGDVTQYSAGSFSEDFRIADVDRDGVPDIVVAVAGTSQVTVLPGAGDGTFESGLDSPVLGGPKALAIGDLNGDGVPDAAVASPNVTAQLLIGQDDGTFIAPVGLATLAQSLPATLEIADLDGDGFEDLVVGYQGRNSISIFRGNGTNELEAPLHFGGPALQIASTAVDLEIADVDGDGKLDIILAGDQSVVVFYAR